MKSVNSDAWRDSCAQWIHLLGTQRSWIMLFMALPSWLHNPCLPINQEPFMCLTNWRDPNKLYLGHTAFQRDLSSAPIWSPGFQKASLLETEPRSDPGMSCLELDALPRQKGSCKVQFLPNLQVLPPCFYPERFMLPRSHSSYTNEFAKGEVISSCAELLGPALRLCHTFTGCIHWVNSHIQWLFSVIFPFSAFITQLEINNEGESLGMGSYCKWALWSTVISSG